MPVPLDHLRNKREYGEESYWLHHPRIAEQKDLPPRQGLLSLKPPRIPAGIISSRVCKVFIPWLRLPVAEERRFLSRIVIHW